VIDRERLSPFLTFFALERFFACVRAFVILKHVLVPKRSLAYSASEDLILTILRRLGTDRRTDRVCTFRRDLRFQLGGFSFRGATSPDDSVVVVTRHIIVVTVVVIVIIIIVVVVIVVAPGSGFRVRGWRYFWQWAKG